jgi:hypothetical protein
MDELERLIHLFQAQNGPSGIAWKLDLLLDLDRLHCPRVLALLLRVLGDADEATAVRLKVLGQLLDGRVEPSERARVAEGISHVLDDRSNPEVRLQEPGLLAISPTSMGWSASLGIWLCWRWKRSNCATPRLPHCSKQRQATRASHCFGA